MKRDATLATSLVIDFLGFLERQGHPRADVCAAASIDPQLFDRPDSRVPANVMERLWRLGEQLTGDPDVGLHSAESYNPGALSIVGYVILSCRTAGAALDCLARYAPLLNEGLHVEFVAGERQTVCRFSAVEAFDSFLHREPRQVMETLAAGAVVTLRRLATGPVEPARVTFRHAAPPSIAEHLRILGQTVHFNESEDSVIYDTRVLQTPFISADPTLLDVFEGDARRRLESLAERGGVSGRVLRLLGSRLRGAVPSLAEIASELAMSERSIQRSLSDEQTSYRQLVDDVRKNLAIEHLARPGTSATDVAFLLGFSEPSAFTRAFRRWTGAAPSEFRAAGA
ncbi:MAG: AraC family transcriptional regulator [Vicinamibacterales bacterium]